MLDNNSQKKPNKKGGLLIYLVILTLICFIGQIVIFLIQHLSYFHAALTAEQDILIPTSTILYPLLVFWSWQILLNVVFVLSVWLTARLSARLLNLSWPTTCNLGFALWITAVVLVFMANQVLYPGSIFSVILAYAIPHILAKILCIISLIIVTIFILLALFMLVKVAVQKYRLISMIILILLCVIIGYAITPNRHQSVAQSADNHRPNIFIISMDALRPDYIDYYGYQKNDSQQLDKFLTKATNFRNCMTPLARTYPAWVSILTGLDPKQNGARFNLQPIDKSIKQNSLPSMLQKRGYHTIFAMSGRRFVNISHDYGFNDIVGPPLGTSNFLIGQINDYPLSNLLINTKIGKYLFPYSYGNRDAATTYLPSVFRHEVEQDLLKVHKRPIFLAAHFDLSHWPFAWAKRPYNQHKSVAENYRIAVKEVQRQAMLLVNFLRAHQFLNKAIVVIISDHGNALGLAGDRLLNSEKYVAGPKSNPNIFKLMNATNFDTPALNISYGHGTDVLSYSQYNNVLAFRTFGLSKNNYPTMIKNMVALTDIKATILNLLNIPYQSKPFAGISLRNYLYNQPPNKIRTSMFVENGFTPVAIESDKISVFNLIQNGAHMYYVDPRTHNLSLKPEAAKQLMKSNKQRAIYTKHWILALYPSRNKQFITILLNRDSLHWTDDLSSKFAKEAPLHHLIAAMNRYYGSEIK